MSFTKLESKVKAEWVWKSSIWTNKHFSPFTLQLVNPVRIRSNFLYLGVMVGITFSLISARNVLRIRNVVQKQKCMYFQKTKLLLHEPLISIFPMKKFNKMSYILQSGVIVDILKFLISFVPMVENLCKL